jgi:transcriptional regulator with PAS, ATPase and Fis domain
LPGFDKIVGASQPVLDVLDRAKRAAGTDSTVLIRGESGTGKELIADAIHENSSRSRKPLVVVNIAAVPKTLLESELFGHVKGAFTDASTHRVGLFEAADGGTLFIDEIGDLALECQAKLLRVLENQKVTPVGGGKARQVDVRVVAATRHNLERMMREGKFREDLYYRLNVVTIRIPPLRERPGDVLLLVDHFLRELCRRNGTPTLEIVPELMEYLRTYDWPGNVRQLRNCIESMVVLGRSQTLTMDDLPATVRGGALSPQPDVTFPANKTLAEMEKLVVVDRLDSHNGNRSHAAHSLGISVRTLQRKLKKWGLQSEAVTC